MKANKELEMLEKGNYVENWMEKMTSRLHPTRPDERARMRMRLQAGWAPGGSDCLFETHPAISWPRAGSWMQLSISS